MKSITFIIFQLCSLTWLGAQGVSIGQACPVARFAHVLHYAQDTAAVDDFAGKPLLIGFWNTHCAVGREFLPKLNLLQKGAGDQLQVLLVTEEPETVVNHALNDLKQLVGLQLPIAVEDSGFRQYFPHKIEPHFVWINRRGKVVAITGHDAVTPGNVKTFVDDGPLNLPVKQEATDPLIFFSLSPLMVNQYPETKRLLTYYAYLGGYRSGVVSLIRVALWNPEDSTLRITAVNQPLLDLYKLAYQQFKGFHRSRIVLHGNLAVGNDKANKLRYCYDLVVKDTARQKAYTWMIQDLDRYFGYNSSWKEQQIPVLVLKKIGTSELFKAKAGRTPDVYETKRALVVQNVPLAVLVQNTFNQRSLLSLPVVNETGYEGNVDLVVSNRYTDLPAVRRSLQAYGLDLIPEKRRMGVLVLKETGKRSRQ